MFPSPDSITPHKTIMDPARTFPHHNASAVPLIVSTQQSLLHFSFHHPNFIDYNEPLMNFIVITSKVNLNLSSCVEFNVLIN